MRDPWHLDGVILDELGAGPRSCSELMRATGLSKFMVRQICRRLERKGLVTGRVHVRTFVCELARNRRAA